MLFFLGHLCNTVEDEVQTCWEGLMQAWKHMQPNTENTWKEVKSYELLNMSNLFICKAFRYHQCEILEPLGS